MLEAIWKLFLKILKIVSLVLQPIKYLCFQLWHKFSHLSCLDNLLTYRGCSCSSWVCHRESCLLNRRRMRSLGYNAPAATKASLPQNLASLSLHSCLGKTKNKKNKNKNSRPSNFFLLSLSSFCASWWLHALLLSRLWTLIAKRGEHCLS